MRSTDYEKATRCWSDGPEEEDEAEEAAKTGKRQKKSRNKYKYILVNKMKKQKEKIKKRSEEKRCQDCNTDLDGQDSERHCPVHHQRGSLSRPRMRTAHISRGDAPK
jgi:hypothetical protein